MRVGLTIVLLLFAAAAAAQPTPVVVDVCGATKMTPTQITVHAHERWTIEVIGSSPACADGKHGDARLHECDHPDCARWADGKRIPPVSPKGWERWYLRPFAYLKRVRSAHWYELTGAVGDPFKQTFAIGLARKVTIDSDGELFLFANDAESRYDTTMDRFACELRGRSDRPPPVLTISPSLAPPLPFPAWGTARRRGASGRACTRRRKGTRSGRIRRCVASMTRPGLERTRRGIGRGG